jgi:hypothetical protein
VDTSYIHTAGRPEISEKELSGVANIRRENQVNERRQKIRRTSFRDRKPFGFTHTYFHYEKEFINLLNFSKGTKVLFCFTKYVQIFLNVLNETINFYSTNFVKACVQLWAMPLDFSGGNTFRLIDILFLRPVQNYCAKYTLTNKTNAEQ